MKQNNIFIISGGTGGHITPGLSISYILRLQRFKIIWIGNFCSLENSLVTPSGFILAPIILYGLRGKKILNLFKFPIFLAYSLLVLLKYFKKFSPKIIFCTGCYISFPGSIISFVYKIPLIVHEQNSIIGTTNKIIYYLCRIMLNGFSKQNNQNSFYSGNPVRQNTYKFSEPKKRYSKRNGRLNILIIGGSLGSDILNLIIPKAINIIELKYRPNIIHQSGKKNINNLKSFYNKFNIHAKCVSFIKNISEILYKVDLVICRSGAMIISEIISIGVAALFVPIPNSINNHQKINADYLSSIKAAWNKSQNKFTKLWLANWLKKITRKNLSNIAKRIKNQSYINSSESIVDILNNISEK